MLDVPSVMRRLMVGCAVAVVSLLAANPCSGQEADDEPLLDELTQLFKKPYLSLGALLQTVGTFQAERSLPGENGFSVGAARLSVGGELDSGFGYFLQTEFVVSPPLLDARLHWRIVPALRLDGGVFKVPFSLEFLTYAGSIDFVSRSRVVIALAPGRQIGLQAGGQLASGALAYSAGVFNGNRFLESNTNDNDDFLYAGRITYQLPWLGGERDDERFLISLNAAYSRDEEVLLIGISDAFAGTRKLLGLDARWMRDRWLVGGELIGADLDPSEGESFQPFGWYLTGGYMIARRSQALLRWDRFRPGNREDPPDRIILGFNHWPTAATEIQLNFGVPTRGGFDESEFFINLQLGF